MIGDELVYNGGNLYQKSFICTEDIPHAYLLTKLLINVFPIKKLFIYLFVCRLLIRGITSQTLSIG